MAMICSRCRAQQMLSRLPCYWALSSASIHKSTKVNSQGRNGFKSFKKTMSAWQMHQYGTVDELTFSDSVEMPVLKNPRDLLIAVHAASVNPIDTLMIGGYGSATLNGMRKVTCSMSASGEFPLTPGRDFSGVVLATGKAVPYNKFKPGDEVWGAGDGWRQGTHAEFTTVSSQHVSLKPKSLTHIEAASLPYVAMSTWAALHTIGGLRPKTMYGKRALILGGSGGIGTFAIQLLKAWGAEVTTTCSADAIDLVLGLGADLALDYKTQDAFKELQQLQGFDVVLDGTGNNPEGGLKLLKKYYNARYITLISPFLKNNDTLPFPFGFVKSGLTLTAENIKAFQEGQSYRWGIFLPNGSAMKEVAKLVDEEKIMPVLEQVYPFTSLKEVYSKVAVKHNRGKSVVDIVGAHQMEAPAGVEDSGV